MNTPRCDAEITPFDGDTSYAATRKSEPTRRRAPERIAATVPYPPGNAPTQPKKSDTGLMVPPDFGQHPAIARGSCAGPGQAR